MNASAEDIKWGREVLADPARIRKIVKAFNDNPKDEDLAYTVTLLDAVLNNRVKETTADEKARAEQWARRVAIERIRKYAPEIKLRTESAEPITKREDAQEKIVSDKVSFSDIVLGPEPVTKAADVEEFEFGPNGLGRVAVPFKLDSPKPEDATKTGPFARPDSFLAPNPDEALTPVIPGGGADMPVTGAGTMMRDLNLLTTEGDPLDEPGTFSPSQPGRNPADGPKSIRLGDARVPLFKRKKPSFADLILGPEGK